MSNLEKIQTAEVQLGQVQDALSVVQRGLEHAEAVAVVAEKAKTRTGRLVKVGLVLGILALVLIVMAKRRSAHRIDADPARDSTDAG